MINELSAMRAAEHRRLATEAAALQAVRHVEGVATTRLDDLSRQVDELREALLTGGGSTSPPVEPGYGPAPEIPWTHEYNAAHASFVAAELEDEALLERFRNGGEPLPDAFGMGFDERVVEFPWIAAEPLGGLVLDAGSALNHRHVLERFRPRVDGLHVLTLAPEEQSFPELGVSYLYADLRDLPMRDGAYDDVICISTLEHVGLDNTRFGVDGTPVAADPQPEAVAAMRELWRILKPGGRLLVTVPVGRGERTEWVRSLTLEQVDELAGACDGADVALECFRHDGGWQRASRDEVAGARYRDHLVSGAPVERVVAAEAIACLRLLKPA
jgi:SAM-dependent methyltransferase